ncbi:MAG TPA: ATP-binding protein [Gemmatimonadaceae bacterium]|nr:ATP-binding protein [Gemmatimonadaceae bacterium]
MSIEQKLPLLIVGLLVLLVGAASIAAYDEVRHTARTTAEARLQSAVQQLSSLSAEGVRRRHETMFEVANHPAVRRLLHGSPVAAEAVTAFRLLLPPDSVQTIEVWDADGNTVARYGTAASADEVRNARTLALRSRDSNAAHGWEGPMYAVADSIFYWTGAPIVEGGLTAGYLMQRRRVYGTASVRQQLEQLTGAGTRFLAYSAPTDIWVTLDGVVSPPPRDVVALGGGLQEYTAPDGTRRLAAVSSVSGTPWSLAADMPLTLIADRPHAFLARMALIALLLVAVGAAGAWGVSRHFTHPLAELTDAAASIASGNYRRRVTVRRRDELGLLAETFNAMTGEVGEAHAALSAEAARSRALAEELASTNTELVASQVATARAAERTARLQLLTAALARAVTPEEVAGVAVEQGIAAVEAIAGMMLVTSGDGALTLVRAAGVPAEGLAWWRYVRADAQLPVAEAARRAEPVFIRSREELHARYPALRTATSSGAWAALPLGMEGQLLGVIGWGFAGARTFEEDERRFLTVLAQQCSQALERARLYDAEMAAREDAERARAVAEHANRAKSDFLAVMSHELRTPLNAIAGYTELLEMELRGPLSAEQREDLRRIRRNQQHLLTLINDVLHFAKLDAGGATIELTSVPVDDAIAELETLVAPQLQARRLTYHFRRCHPGIMVEANRDRFQQILLNIISNAIKFTEPGGEIDVWCEEASDTHVRVQVRDTGIGIPADRLDAVFDPFVQVYRTLTRTHEGIGLGLSISRELARQMGGDITVESTEGVGSVFTLTLVRPGMRTQTPRDGGAGAPSMSILSSSERKDDLA